MAHTAVIDIGKTNKKILIFDESLKCIHSVKAKFEEYESDGLILEDMKGMVDWLWESFRTITGEYEINCVSITTHGAFPVCVDEQGDIAVPAIAYTHEPGEEFHKEFFETFGDKVELQKSTCTADFGNLINAGKGVYLRKKLFPDDFKKVKHVLGMPQYFGFLLTGVAGAEPTYTGCHTYMYDYHKKGWSSVSEQMGIAALLPDTMKKPWDVLGTVSEKGKELTGLSTECVVTLGIHDSNSSLLPHLIKKGGEQFVLDSTGTWCVAMSPADSLEFKDDELGGVVFYNLSAFGDPVKTSIYPGGMEFEAFTDVFKVMYKDFSFYPFNADVMQKVIDEKRIFMTPSIIEQMGMFNDSRPRMIAGDAEKPLEEMKNTPSGIDAPAEEIYAALNLSLAIQSRVNLGRAGAENGTDVFIEGGFRNNDSYAAAMTALLPDSNIVFTSIEEATAFGAALLGKAALEGKTPMDLGDTFDVEYEPVPKADLKGIEEYVSAYLTKVS